MRYLTRLATAAALVVLVSGSTLRAQISDAAQHLKDLARANSLDVEGTQPWHLRMTFQLNDLNGKPKENGTIEEWWVSPQARRLEVRSASYNLTIPSDPSVAATPATGVRESYLVNELLNQIVHPIPDYKDFKDLDVTEASRTFGKVSLTCIGVQQANLKSSTPPLTQFCFSPGSSLLRAHLDAAQFGAVRNDMVTFRGIGLGRDNTLMYGHNQAISGHLDTLESFHPDGSIVLTTSAPPPTIPNVVLAGKIIKKTVPEYPFSARQQHIAGTVLLSAIISKQGTIADLDVVASPDATLTSSAIDAVKRWTYQPYLLNGQPTEVDTTITVNYNLNY
jgi:TonB family protein